MPSGTDVHFYKVSFVDSLHGWVCGYSPGGIGGFVYSTSDGGLTWVEQLHIPDTIFFDIDFIDLSNGWVVGKGGIWTTSDGGSTWIKQYGEITDYLMGVCFVDSLHGWVVGQTVPPASSHSIILATSDGGTTWIEQGPHIIVNNFPVKFTDVFFLDLMQGWIVGSNGIILRTSDGGSTWTQITSGRTELLAALSFTDQHHGWIVGDFTIIATNDGGDTWVTQSSEVIDRLRDVCFIDPFHGWTVGWPYAHAKPTILSYNPPVLADFKDEVVEASENTVYFIYPDYQGVKPPGIGYASLSDWTATGFIIGMCSNKQIEVTDTNSTIIDTNTGMIKVNNSTIVLFGGPLVNAPVNYYETNRIAPLYWQSISGTYYWFLNNSTRIEETAMLFSDMAAGHQDMFMIETFTDSLDNRIFIIYGYGWKGTFAGGKFFKFVIYPDIESYTDSFYVFKWTDNNSNGFVDLDEIITTPVVSG